MAVAAGEYQPSMVGVGFICEATAPASTALLCLNASASAVSGKASGRAKPLGSGPFSLGPEGNLLVVRVEPSNSDVMLVTPFR